MQNIIKIKFAGKTRIYKAIGRGAYPYSCISKDRYPNSMIYQNDTGGWVPEHDLKLQDDGVYTIVSWDTLP